MKTKMLMSPIINRTISQIRYVWESLCLLFSSGLNPFWGCWRVLVWGIAPSTVMAVSQYVSPFLAWEAPVTNIGQTDKQGTLKCSKSAGSRPRQSQHSHSMSWASTSWLGIASVNLSLTTEFSQTSPDLKPVEIRGPGVKSCLFWVSRCPGVT